jgi:hypothetical protein
MGGTPLPDAGPRPGLLDLLPPVASRGRPGVALKGLPGSGEGQPGFERPPTWDPTRRRAELRLRLRLRLRLLMQAKKDL